MGPILAPWTLLSGLSGLRIAPAGIQPTGQHLINKGFSTLKTLKHEHNWRHFAEDIFKYIYANENVFIDIQIALMDSPNTAQDTLWRATYEVFIVDILA